MKRVAIAGVFAALAFGCSVGRGDFVIETRYQAGPNGEPITKIGKDGDVYFAEVPEYRKVRISSKFLEHSTDFKIDRDEDTDQIVFNQVGDPSPGVVARANDLQAWMGLIAAAQALGGQGIQGWQNVERIKQIEAPLARAQAEASEREIEPEDVLNALFEMDPAAAQALWRAYKQSKGEE